MDKTEKHNQQSIRRKLVISYSVFVLIIFLLGAAGIYGMHRVNSNASLIYSNYLQTVDSLRRLTQNLHEIDRDVTLLVTGTGDQDSSDYVYEILVLQTQNGYLLEEYEQLADKDAEHYQQCRQGVEAYNTKVNAILAELEAGAKPDSSAACLEATNVLSLLDTMTAQAIRSAGEKNVENQQLFSLIIAATIIICTAAAIIASVITVYISNYFTRRLDTIRSFAKRMAEYDISDDIQDTEDDEISKTIRALNDSQFMIRDLIEKIIAENAEMSDMGTDISNALRKTAGRLQEVSVLLMESRKMAEDADTVLSGVLASGGVEASAAVQLRKLLTCSEDARAGLNEVMGEMNSINMHLEQIAVTSDYQNEIANSHRERISRFKLQQSSSAQEETPEKAPEETKTDPS